MSAISYRQRGSGAGPSGQKRRPPESLVGGSPYDHLWMWTCFNYSSNSSSTELSINTPKDAGKWSIWALTVSRAGLRFSAPVKLEVFRPLTVDFHLPPSLKVREILEVDIKIGNNINSCVDVTALLALSEGAQFVSNGLLYVTEKLRLGPLGATSLVVKILSVVPGAKNLTVEVNGYASSTCEGRENISNSTLSGAVIHSATVEVFLEGCEKIHTESSYFCANEHLMFSTRDNYNYQWMQAPKRRESIIVEVKVSRSKSLGPIHIALAECKTQPDKVYTITIGDADNTLSHIGRGNRHLGVQLASSETPDILSEDTWKLYWITWSNNIISFGAGSSPFNKTLLKWKMDKKVKVVEIGFASAWGALAGFRVWSFDEKDGTSEILDLDRIKDAVTDSQRGDLTFVGGLAIPRTSKTDGGGLVGALATLTPLLTVGHMEVTEPNDNLRLDVVRVLPETIQTILSFKKQDDSFSEHPMLGSHRVTVSVLEALSKIQLYFNIDPDLIQAVKRWVQLRQEDDGRFTPLDGDVKVIDTNTSKGAVRRNLSAEVFHFENIVEITAETVIALYEIGIETDADSDTLQKAKIFLENSLPNVESPETIAAVAFALVLVRSATAAWAVEKLRNASTTEDGEFGWPNFTPKRDAADWLYESESQNAFGPIPCVATVEQYRASLYALSTFCLIGDLKSAQSVATFLINRSEILDNHYELRYPAVTAFSEYNSMANDQHRELIIALATSGMEFSDTLHFNNQDSFYKVDLPSLPTKVLLYATGAGCATIQGRAFYSTYVVKDKTSLLEIRSGIVEEILPDRSSIEEIEGKLPAIKIETCFKWKGDHPSPVLRLEVILFSGFEVSPNPPQLLNAPQKMAEMQHGSRGNKLWFIFANISTPCPVCVQYNARSTFVISAIRPAYAKVYPVSREDLAADVFFHAKGASALLNSVRSEDMNIWFGAHSGMYERFEVPAACEKKEVATAARNIPGEIQINSKEVKLVSLMEYTINAESELTMSGGTTQKTDPTTEFSNSVQSNLSTTTQPEQSSTIEPVKFYKAKKVVDRKFRKVLIGQVQTGKASTTHIKFDPKISKQISKEKPKLAENISAATKLPKVTSPTPAAEPRTHQTITVSTTKSSKVKDKMPEKKPNRPNVILHVNTEQIHQIPSKLAKAKVESDNNDIDGHADSQYVLLNKDSL
uniref:Alpha-2-macroglobulin domain-containing protein n=2 Tax=Dendroctonus ponderosae TaxID=77166 RepID=A0AAR5P944_DENPD